MPIVAAIAIINEAFELEWESGMNNFYVGQKVVCIHGLCDDSSFWLRDAPIEGSIYTVTAVGEFFGMPCLLLREITNLCFKDGVSCEAYRASRFRPLLEKKTDISIFRKMLVPSEREFA